MTSSMKETAGMDLWLHRVIDPSHFQIPLGVYTEVMTTREITEENLESTIDGKDIVLLDFWAGWCGPCRMFAPVFEKAAEENPDAVFGKIDTEAQQGLAAGFRITSIPTLMVFRQGIIVFAQPGALGETQLNQVIEAARALDMDEVRAKIATEQAASGQEKARVKEGPHGSTAPEQSASQKQAGRQGAGR